MREGIHQKGASPKGLGWPLHREKRKKRGFMGFMNTFVEKKIGNLN